MKAVEQLAFHMHVFAKLLPILSSKVGPLYHSLRRGSLQGPERFSPVSPLQGTYTTSESYKAEKEKRVTQLKNVLSLVQLLNAT